MYLYTHNVIYISLSHFFLLSFLDHGNCAGAPVELHAVGIHIVLASMLALGSSWHGLP